MSGSPALESVLGALLFLLELPCPVFNITFVLNYYILLLNYYIRLLSLRSVFFSSDRQKDSGGEKM